MVQTYVQVLSALWERLVLMNRYNFSVAVAIIGVHISISSTGAFWRLNSHSTKKIIVSAAEIFVLVISTNSSHSVHQLALERGGVVRFVMVVVILGRVPNPVPT